MVGTNKLHVDNFDLFSDVVGLWQPFTLVNSENESGLMLFADKICRTDPVYACYDALRLKLEMRGCLRRRDTAFAEKGIG